MRHIFLDIETHMDVKKGLTLAKMSLRAYLPKAPIIGISVAVDHGAPTWCPADSPDFVPLVAELDEAGQDPDTTLIAYNAAFDLRVLRYGVLEKGGDVLGSRWPLRIHDAMELAMAAWPNMPGGYSLRNVSAWLCLPPKLSMEDVRHGRCTWEQYCNRDCELLQEIYYRALPRVPADELLYAEMCNQVRGLCYQIKRETVQASVDAFAANAAEGVAAALELITAEGSQGEDFGSTLFGGYADGKVRSVKPLALREVLRSVFGFSTLTTSRKKINPNHLAARPDVDAVLAATSQTSKSLYYKNRATAISGVDEIDMEKGYFRATNTGRTSAPSTGRGINTANLTKKDKKIAKPLRQMLALPDHLCYVRADAANVEYRVAGVLADIQYVKDLFSNNINADPYSSYALAAFGVKCAKGEPMRDVVAKTAVLAYQFGMGNGLAVSEMNKSVADPINKVSVQQMHELCLSRGWKEPRDRYLKSIITKTGCHWSVGVAAYESRKAFHQIHPEMFRMGDWLVDAVTLLAAHPDPSALIDSLYRRGDAPDRNKLELSIDTQLEFPSVRVRLFGHSMPTVTWRQLSCSHPGINGLGAVTANKGPRNVHRSLVLGNVTQSSARIGLLRCENELAKRGWLTDSVYDEILVICPRERDAVLRAREDIKEIMGPNGPHQMGWAFYAKPSEITVTRTRYEDEAEAAKAWAKLEANDPTWVEHLT